MPRVTDPNDRESFKKLIRMKLGEPVIQVNVSNEQVEIAVDEALKWYEDYHYNGTEHVYWIKTVDQTDIDNRYVTVPDDIIGVNDVYSLATTSLTSGNILNGSYGLIFDIGFNLSSGSMLSFYMSRMQYEFIQQMIIGQTPLRFNQHTNRVYIDANWGRWGVGENIVLDAYQRVDPDVHTEVWSDRWLIRYAVAKVQYQWGLNTSKYSNMPLPGGVQINGDRLLTDATNEITKIEEEILSNYSMPVRDIVY